MKKIQSFVREHQLWRNALWLLLFVPLFFLSQLPLISMLFSIRNGLDAWIVTLLTLVATVVVLFVFYVVMKKSPLENIDIRVITWPALGRNFLFFLLLIANNMLAYPLLQQEGSDTTKNQMVLMELQAHAPFFAMGMVVVLVAPILEELLCRAIIPRLIFRGAEPIGYLTGALFFTYLHGPSTLGEWVAYGGMSLIITWVAYRYKRIEYSICLHMTLNALAYYSPAVLLLCLLPVSRVFFPDKL